MKLLKCHCGAVEAEINLDGVSDTLIYILEGGFRGYHKFTADQLKAEWLDGANDKWFQLYEDGELPWEIFEDDPLAEEAA